MHKGPVRDQFFKFSVRIDLITSIWSAFRTSVQHSEEFHSGTGRDGIEVQSRDPGIFRDGISLIFQSRDCLEIVRDFSGLTFLMQLVII